MADDPAFPKSLRCYLHSMLCSMGFSDAPLALPLAAGNWRLLSDLSNCGYNRIAS